MGLRRKVGKNMEINWKPITNKLFELKPGMFLYSGEYVYLVGHISFYDIIYDNKLVVSYKSELGVSIYMNNVTHYISTKDLTDEQILYLYKKSLES